MNADDVALVRAAAIAAGERALAVRRAGLTTTMTGDGTPVTNADIEVDSLLKEILTDARPDYGWLSEETADDPARIDRTRIFVVDPIDGTSAYLKHRPWWTVSIAVVEAGRPTAAIVHAPDVAETYEAQAGSGASRNGEAIAPSAAAAIEGCAMLGDAPMFAHPAWPQPWPPMRIETRNSIAYRLCLVAAGAFDAALALSSKGEWDLAAADLIAREAGCLVTTHKGRDIAYNRRVPRVRSMVCAGTALHGLLLDRLAPIELPGSSETD
jgi:myo-inositol-1(or 4)-monophosphatase